MRIDCQCAGSRSRKAFQEFFSAECLKWGEVPMKEGFVLDACCYRRLPFSVFWRGRHTELIRIPVSFLAIWPCFPPQGPTRNSDAFTLQCPPPQKIKRINGCLCVLSGFSSWCRSASERREWQRVEFRDLGGGFQKLGDAFWRPQE